MWPDKSGHVILIFTSVLWGPKTISRRLLTSVYELNTIQCITEILRILTMQAYSFVVIRVTT